MNNDKSNQYPVPCKSISKIDAEHTEIEIDAELAKIDFNTAGEHGELVFGFVVGFPGQIKLITQSQAVDINSFIGNIGGYIGLFLGKFI